MADAFQQLNPHDRDVAAEAMQAFHNDDAGRLRDILDRHPALKPLVNAPIASFDAPPIVYVRSRRMLDVLLDAGADINGRSRWWAGGFGVLDCASPDVSAYAIERGAAVDAHAAARLGLADRLRDLLERDPAAVHARGGDGQTPLHFATTGYSRETRACPSSSSPGRASRPASRCRRRAITAPPRSPGTAPRPPGAPSSISPTGPPAPRW